MRHSVRVRRMVGTEAVRSDAGSADDPANLALIRTDRDESQCGRPDLWLREGCGRLNPEVFAQTCIGRIRLAADKCEKSHDGQYSPIHGANGHAERPAKPVRSSGLLGASSVQTGYIGNTSNREHG